MALIQRENTHQPLGSDRQLVSLEHDLHCAGQRESWPQTNIHVAAPDGWDILVVVAGHTRLLHWVAHNHLVVVDVALGSRHQMLPVCVYFLQRWRLGIPSWAGWAGLPCWFHSNPFDAGFSSQYTGELAVC